MLRNHRDEATLRMRFLDNKILQETNLVCAFARADKILNDENSTREDLHQSRSFLVEIFGKLEKILAGVKDSRMTRRWPVIPASSRTSSTTCRAASATSWATSLTLRTR